MLGVRRDDLVARSESEARDDDIAAVGGRARDRDVLGCGSDQLRELSAHARTEREDAVEPRAAASSLVLVEPVALRHCSERRLCERPERPRIEIREAREHWI